MDVTIDDLAKNFEKDTSAIERKSNVKNFFTNLLSELQKQEIDIQGKTGRYIYKDGKLTVDPVDVNLTNDQKEKQVQNKLNEFKSELNDLDLDSLKKYAVPAIGVVSILLIVKAFNK